MECAVIFWAKKRKKLSLPIASVSGPVGRAGEGRAALEASPSLPSRPPPTRIARQRAWWPRTLRPRAAASATAPQAGELLLLLTSREAGPATTFHRRARSSACPAADGPPVLKASHGPPFELLPPCRCRRHRRRRPIDQLKARRPLRQLLLQTTTGKLSETNIVETLHSRPNGTESSAAPLLQLPMPLRRHQERRRQPPTPPPPPSQLLAPRWWQPLLPILLVLPLRLHQRRRLPPSPRHSCGRSPRRL
jgi:hypothetical protein